MNIALIGYGKMGTEIERILNEEGGHSVRIADFKNNVIDLESIRGVDVAIDFSSPEIVLGTIERVLHGGIPLVVGTTGWYEKLPTVEGWVKNSNGTLLYGQNFSVGANIFFKLVAYASKLASTFGSYDPYGTEIHHAGKKDSPSGTALRTAKEILDNFPAKTRLETGRLDRTILPEELHFSSVRGGVNPGFHEVVFDSAADAITLSHTAHSREGFAKGAVLAAKFLAGKKGLYTFDDVFNAKQTI